MAENHWGVPLRDYVERVFEEKEKALTILFEGQREALALARDALELRLERLNELREEVTQDRANYVTRERYEAELAIDRAQYASLAAFQNRLLGIGLMVVLGTGLLGAILTRVFFH